MLTEASFLRRVLTFVLFDIFIAIKIVCTQPLCVPNIYSKIAIKVKYSAKLREKQKEEMWLILK